MSEENTTDGGTNTPNPETSGNSISNTPEYGLNFNNLSFSQGPTEQVRSFDETKEFMDDTTQFGRYDNFESAALNQSGWEALGRGAMNAVGEVVGGGIEGIGALFNWDTLNDPKNTERNFLEMLGQEVRGSFEDGNEIYDLRAGETMDVMNVKWWAKNLPSLASTASMFVPGLGAGFVAAKVLSKAGRTLNKINKIGKTLDKAEELASVAKAGNIGSAIGRQFGGAVAMRHAENMRSAHDVYEQAYTDIANSEGGVEQFKGTTAWRAAVEELGHQPTKEELAEYVAGQASLKSYKVNSLNIGFDLLHMGALSKALKGTRGVRRGLKGAQQKAAAAGKELTRAQRNIARAKGLGATLFEAGTEGIEESINFIGENEGRYLGKEISGGEQTKLEDRMKDYIADDHMWESAFLGALGGGVMAGGGSVIGRGKATRNHEKIMEQIETRKKALAEIGKKVDAASKTGDVRAQREAVREAVTAEAFGMGAESAYSGTADLLEIQLAQFEEALREEGHSQRMIEQTLSDVANQFTVAEKSVEQGQLVVQELGLEEDTGMEVMNQLLQHDFIANQILNKREANTRKLQGLPKSEERKQEIMWHYLNEYLNKEEEQDAKVIERLEEAMGGREAVQAMTERIVGKVEQNTTVDTAAVAAANEKLDLAMAKVESLKAAVANQSDNESAKRQLAEELIEANAAVEAAKTGVETAKAGTTEDIVTEGTPIQEVGENKADDVLQSEIELDFQEAELAKQRAAFLSDENIDKLVEQSEERRANKEKERTKKRKEAKKEAKTKEELEALKKTAETTEEEQEIDDALTDMVNQAKNNETQKEQERSKDIQVPTEVQKDIDTLLENSKYVELNEEGTHYVDSRTGQQYVRTTTWMKGPNAKEESFSDTFGIPSSNIGNSVDEFVRDFMDGNVRTPEAYPHLPTELQEKLALQLMELEAQFVANGEKVIAKDVVLFNDMDVSNLDASASGVAGTVDLLTVDAEGNFRVYDMKTIRNAASKKKVVSIPLGDAVAVRSGKAKYGPGDKSYKGSPTLEQKHQKQLSAYRLMLMNQLGRPVPEIGIIPVDVSYDTNDSLSKEELNAIVTGRADYLGMIAHTPLAELNGLAEPTVNNAEPDPDDAPDPGKDDTKDEDPQDNQPVTTVELEPGTVTIETPDLIQFFTEKLSVDYDRHRGEPYLVHTASGPIVMNESLTKDQMLLLQEVISGANTEPVTIRVVGDTTPIPSVEVFDALKDTHSADSLLTKKNKKGRRQYRPSGKGDTLALDIFVGDQRLGTLPNTSALMMAAHRRGMAESTSVIKGGKNKGLMFRQKSVDGFGVGSRVGEVRRHENRMMTGPTQAEHFERAAQMHALRQQLWEMHTANGKNMTNPVSFPVNLNFGETSFGNKAQGSLIMDSSMEVRAEQYGVGASIRRNGIALMMPNTGSMEMSLKRSGERAAPITPYGYNETRHQQDGFNLSRHESGALFVPIESAGEVIWVKMPGQTVSMLNNGERITRDLITELADPTLDSIARAQNIIGSNIVKEIEPGVFAIFADNRNIKVPESPENLAVSIYRDGQWSTPLEEIIPNMNVDIAVKLDQGESAFNTDESFTVGGTKFEGISDFVASEMKLGHSPVVDGDGNVISWTHPLAPAYPYNEGDKDKSFSNENTMKTQLTMTATVLTGGEVKPVTKLSGKALLDGLMTEDPTVPEGDNAFDVEGDLDFSFLTVAAAESSNNADRATEVDMKEAEEWWAKNMSAVPFKRVKGIIERNGLLGYGIFEKGAVEVSDRAVKGTEYHEAFHAVFQMFLSDSRQEKVMADAVRLYGKKSKEALEEDLAEDFREYMMTSGKSMNEKSVVRRFFSELMELINALTKEGFSGYRKAKLFQQINRGKFNNASPRVREYATRNMLIAENLPDYNENVQKELLQNVQAAAFTAIRAAQRGKAPAPIMNLYNDLKQLNAMSRKEYNTMAEKQGLQGIQQEDLITQKMVQLGMQAMIYQANKVLKTAPNRAELSARYKQLFKKDIQPISAWLSNHPTLRTFTKGALDTEFTAGTNQHQQNNDEFERMNPKDSLSANVRNLINTTPEVSIELSQNSPEIEFHMAAARLAGQEGDFAKAQEHIAEVQRLVNTNATETYFGLPQMMHVDRVFSFMSERLANKATPEAMTDELFRMGDSYPQFKLLGLRLMKETPDVRAQFFSGFRRGDTTELVVNNRKFIDVRGPFGGTLSNHNRVPIQLRMEEIAAAKNKDLVETARDAQAAAQRVLKEVADMTPEQFDKTANKWLDVIGFQTMDPQARGVVLTKIAQDPDARAKLFANIANVLGAYSGVANAKDVTDLTSDKLFNKHLLKLSEQFQAADMGAISTTFNNVAGSRQFSKQVPSFITEWFDQFQNFPEGTDIEAKLRETVFRDPRMYATSYGKLLFPNGASKPMDMAGMAAVRTYRLGGNESTQAKYTEMTEEEWLGMLISAVSNPVEVAHNSKYHFLPITTPSDATNTMMVPAFIYDMRSDAGKKAARMQLRKTIKSEFYELQRVPGRFTIGTVQEYLSKELNRKNEDGEGNFQIDMATLPEELLDEAVNRAVSSFAKEAQELVADENFQRAKQRSNRKESNDMELALTMVVSGYMSNWSTGVALAGTPNEFNSKLKKNTVDMQKRHKHIMSPGVANAGVTARSHFRSVTMVESVENLQKLWEGLDQTFALDDNYKNVEIADAQSYVSLEFYEDILMEHGDWTPAIGAAIAKAKKGEKLDASDVKLLRPYKPFYYARQFDADLGMSRSYQIKNSIIPVVGALSPEFKKFEDWMRASDVHQVQMGTAHKVGQHKNNIPLRNAEGEFTGVAPTKEEKVAFDEEFVYELPMTGYRKQVNVTDHWHSDSENKLASQLEKIVTAAAVRNMGEEGARISNEFVQTMDEIYKEQYDKFFDQFKTENGEVNSKEFAEWLLSEMADDEVTDSSRKLIEAGMFTAPSVVGAVRGRIFSAVQKEVNTIQVNGGTQVQVASQFFRTNKNRLLPMRKEGGKIMPAQIAVSKDSLPKKYRDMTIEEIRAKAPEVLQSITLRIPSESINSGALVEIVEFLPDGMDGVIVPDEFVTQMGSDFDVDKLFFQFRANDNSKQDKLFDLMKEVFEDERNLKYIMAPQGFDTFSAKAKSRPIRTQEAERQIVHNPLSLTTHVSMRSDNMAGVALKGKAANRNIIFEDLIRNGFVYSSPITVNGNKAGFDYRTVSDTNKNIHSEAVAAAMDGAKDPVYGKLGITDDNFSMFMELVMLSDGDLDAAIDLVQSDVMRMEGAGHIRIMNASNDTVVVMAQTEKGEKFLEAAANNSKESSAKYHPEKFQFTVRGSSNLNTNTKDMGTLMAGIGTWREQVSEPMRHINKVIRLDKKNVKNDIESVMLTGSGNEDLVHGSFFTPGKPHTSETETKGEFAAGLPIKNRMKSMFNETSKLLNDLGDGYLTYLTMHSEDRLSRGLKMAQWDAFKRNQAAAIHTDKKTYTAMGERKNMSPGLLPENKEDWSLENWLRYLRTSDEVKDSPALGRVISKLLVQPKPYEVRGTFFDNITLVGISDEVESRQLSEDVQELYDSDNDDLVSFVEAIDTYEAQRSGYGMSQSRLTGILPSAITMAIARATGAHGKTDEAMNAEPNAIIQEDIWNPNIPRINKPLSAAVAQVADSGMVGVFRTNDGHIIFPTHEQNGEIEWGSAKSPNEGQKFNGKRKLEGFQVHETSKKNDNWYSKLSYGPESSRDDKIEHLKSRFRKAGIHVQVEFDSSLPENGRVVIDKGAAKITLHPDTLQGDTIAHEFGHILVEGLGFGNPLVQQGIEELRDSELWAQVEEAYPELNDRDLGMEVLVTAIGRKGSELFEEQKNQSKFKTIYNRIMRAIGKLFGITPKATEQLAEKLMSGDITDISLNNIVTEQYQRRTNTLQTAIEDSRREVAEHLQNMRRRGGTSEEAQDALNRAWDLEKRLKSKATNGVKMAAVKNAAEDATNLSFTVVESLEDYMTNADSNITRPGMRPEEQVLLDQAYTLREEMNRLKLAIASFDGIETVGPAQKKLLGELMQARNEMERAYDQLDQFAREAISKKLMGQSTDKALTEADLDGINVFDLFDYSKTQQLAKDSSGVGSATLGGAELKNAVMQLSHKLASGIMDSSNFDSKQDAAKVNRLLDSVSVPLDKLMTADGKYLITEFSREYYEAREKARRQGPLALAKFDSANTEMEQTQQYMNEFGIEHSMNIESRVFELKNRLRNPQLNNALIRKQSRELATELEHMALDFPKYHNVEVAEGFQVAYEEAKRTQEEEIARIDAAREAGEDYDKDYDAVNALNAFVAEHAVAMIDGTATPMRGKFAKHTVKDEFQNKNFDGKAKPKTEHVNAEWTAASDEVKTALNELKEVFTQATGSHGQRMIERGYVPTYKSHKGESTTEGLKRKAEKLREKIDLLKDKKERDKLVSELKDIEHMIGNEQGVDSQGNPIYTTNNGAWTFAHKNNEFEGFADDDAFKNNIRQFVIDSHKQTGRRSLEAVAYLTRGYLADSKVVDNKHTFGKKGAAWKAGGNSNIIKTFDAFFEGTIADNWRDKSSLDSFADNVQTYTSLMGVGLNPAAWVNNYGYGVVQNRLANLGEGAYTKDSLKKANKLLQSKSTKLLSDVWTGERSLEDKAMAIIHSFDIAEDQRELPFNMRESGTSKAMSKSFIGQTYGELMLQNSVMFAMMMDTEVVLADGEVTNLYDALEHDPQTGTISFPEGATMKSGARQVPLNSNTMGAFTNKVRHQNQYVHGAYNKQDAGLLQRQWYGRLAMQFRRWLPMGMKTRFTARHYNEAREREEIGTYRALREVLAATLQDVQEARKLFAKLDTLSPEDQFMQRHARRAIIEVMGGAALLAGTALAVSLLGGGDDENWLTAFALSRTERLGMELITYTPIGLMNLTNQIGKDPMAGGARIENLIKIGTLGVVDMARLATGQGFAVYEGGLNRGKSKLAVKTGKAIPLYDHAKRLIDIPSNYMAYSEVKNLIG